MTERPKLKHNHVSNDFAFFSLHQCKKAQGVKTVMLWDRDNKCMN